MLFARLLHKVVQKGQLTVIGADARARSFGDGTGPAIVIRLHQSRLHSHLFFNPELHVGEAYMDGHLTVEHGSLYDFVDLIMSNLAAVQAPWAMRLYRDFGPCVPGISAIQSRRQGPRKRRAPLRSVRQTLRPVP